MCTQKVRQLIFLDELIRLWKKNLISTHSQDEVMATLLEAIILGLVQGITEWLPISSSGHLVLAQHLLEVEEPVVFDVVLHFGSVLVIFLVFWKDILKIIRGFFKGEEYAKKFVAMLVIASVPIGFIGYFFNEPIKGTFESTKVVGISLLITAVLLFLSKFPKEKKKELTWKNTIAMGLFQALAILPGVSRSGSTISSGLFFGVKREEAAKFSFLLAIPAILGANVLEISNVSQVSELGPLIIATVVTVISGFLSLKLLLKIIKNNYFHHFGWYCLGVGFLVLFFL